MKIRSPYNYVPNEDVNEVNSLPSMATPDLSMTVRDMVQRLARGLPVTGAIGSPAYSENPDFDDFDPTEDPAFDLADYTTHAMLLAEERRARLAKEAESAENDKGSSDEAARSKADSEGSLSFSKLHEAQRRSEAQRSEDTAQQ